MTKRDKELTKQAWTENDWDGHVDIPKLIQLVRADEREKVIAEFMEDGVLGYDGAVVQTIRARGNT
ncbi:hypothetical protein UFOVP1309_84 [uncultured Caudovirales phage]|uniref:Uncharacterized protein n=1 Tax=uncultured Caudovirales phage TaxID=2100421 RepID=A0A6J5RLY7_9CAUD|nr:hypothetical protein UFOVP1309_84 [uncultured Caudovirales phage]